ncbi:hypothetical protein HDE_11161 [Halotydeus destructor]|nr:hypothetical protein HDE_11161 [Halotydeus destructor]
MFLKLSHSNRLVCRCNITYVTEFSSGMKVNGSYSGLLGYLERNDVSTVHQAFRPAQLADDVVIVGPTICPTGLQIVSAKGEVTNKANDMLNVTPQIGAVAYFYLSICCFLVLAIAGFLLVGRKNRPAWSPCSYKKFVRATIRSCWNLLITLVQQDNLNPVAWATRLVWICFCCAIFFMIFAVLLNLMSVDGIVGKAPERIDRVIDLFQGTYSTARVGMLKNFYYFTSVKLAPPRSNLGILYQRIIEANDCSDFNTCTLFAVDPAQMASSIEAMRIFNKTVSELGNAFLVDDSVFDQNLKPFVCLAIPSVGPKIHVSRDRMLSDYASIYFSKGTNPRVIKFLSYKLATFLLESGSARITIEKAYILLSESGPMPFEEQIFRRCLDGASDDEDDESRSAALSLSLFRKTLWLCGFGFLLSPVALVAEFSMRRNTRLKLSSSHTGSMQPEVRLTTP